MDDAQPDSCPAPARTCDRASSSPALAALVGDVDRFAGAHWGRSAWRGRPPGPLPSLTVADVEAMLDGVVRRPTIRLVRGGAAVPPGEWTRSLRLGGVELDDIADPRRVAEAFADGASIVLQGLHRTWRSLADHARTLEREIGHPVQTNAYLTPANATALAEHADAHDVFVVQQHGTKWWCVDGLGEFVLQPGDVLHVPAGVRHRARTDHTVSLHLTVGVHRRTMGQLLERLARLDDIARRPLPLGMSRLDQGELLDHVRCELQRLIESLTSRATRDDALLAALGSWLDDAPGWRPAGSLQAVADATTIGADDRVRVVADCRIAPAPDDPRRPGRRVQVSDAVRTLTLPEHTRPALEALLAARELRVRDLPGLDLDGRIVLARRLVRDRLAEVSSAGRRAER